MNKYLKLTLLLFSVLVLNRVQANAQALLVAHRGASFRAPENTLASVELAWKLGAKAVEIDVHLSKDGKIMVNHDKNTQRTGEKKLLIKEALSNDLRKLDVGSFKHKKYKGEQIPFLEEVMATVPEDGKLFIEVKCGPEVLETLKENIAQSGKQGQMVIISFSKKVVTQAKAVLPEVPVYWLRGNYKAHSLEEIIQIVKEHNLDGLDVSYKLVTPAFAERMKQEKIAVFVYTVNDPELAQQLVDNGVQGITTDRPGWLRKKLKL
ncbi:glycerophosphodiester phosphodiesterase [Rapidithrix thailandica]|uniref:Glycerophosphodiester phosphodiesterase n=1 Tax=Rapidithrix thailandica TaxID=413964 RepID=A0AAW9RXP6_9BACT